MDGTGEAEIDVTGEGSTPARPLHVPTAFQRRLPNALTMARVVMTIAFVAVLSVYRFPDVNAWALPTALVLFVVAAVTDALDGYLARKWNAISVFGRIVDPLADKVLILGAFIMLAGPGFWCVRVFPEPAQELSWQTSGVASWMVIVILTRELLVTTLRGAMEGRGVDFSAMMAGKLKMIAQAIAVPLILILVLFAAFPHFVSWESQRHVAIVAESEAERMIANKNAHANLAIAHLLVSANIAIAWCVTVVTAVSVVPYITRALAAMRREASRA